ARLEYCRSLIRNGVGRGGFGDRFTGWKRGLEVCDTEFSSRDELTDILTDRLRKQIRWRETIPHKNSAPIVG
ncbi:MAG: hypothetical protein V5A25_12120, partial [Halovenus sp.]